MHVSTTTSSTSCLNRFCCSPGGWRNTIWPLVVASLAVFMQQSLPAQSGGTSVELTATLAAQIQVSQTTTLAAGSEAVKALDGLTTTYSQTDTTTANNAWSMILPQDCYLDKIEIWNRSTNFPERLDGLIVRVFDSSGTSVFSEVLTNP